MRARLQPAEFVALDDLLREALELDLAARDIWLARLQIEQPAHAARLADMLEAAEDESDAVLTSALDARLWANLAGDSASGQRFGAWRVIGTLAHGGMARVLLAERADGAFDAHAAVKCLWPGLATPSLIARFEQERQILARLDDPRIARLLDGGVREDGVPWLALEFVDGRPIDVHCDTLSLDLDARIALWLDVAAAVATAHRHLVVHRDLKPANVLVSRDGAVKLLDFGIAKLLEPDDFPHAAPPTQIEARAHTRDYASPEQLRGEGVTTASDVYQLGLLLYELASGVQPFRVGPVGGREHNILEIDPPAPSQSVRAGDDAPLRASTRSSVPARLARRLHGDFDAIVLTALAKRGEARYPTVEAFCEDLARWRRGMPVRARRAGLLRRSAKWLRRNALIAAAATSVSVMAIAYGVTAVAQSRAIAHEAAVNRAVRDYLVGWMQQADPGGTAGRDPTASEMLADGLVRARRDLTDQPELQAEILSIVSDVYIARGEYDVAAPVLREADALYARLPTGRPEARNRTKQILAKLLHLTGYYAEAEATFRKAVDERTAVVGGRAYGTLAARQGYADVLHTRGHYAQAIDVLESALADSTNAFGPSHSLTANIGRNLADVYRDDGRIADAEKQYAIALDVFRSVHGELHVNTAVCELGIGRLKLEQGRLDEAVPILAGAFERYRQIKGINTSASSYYERHLAEIEEMRGEYAQAETRLARLVESVREELPAGHLLFGYFALHRAYVALSRRQDEQARAFFATAAGAFAAVQPEGHPRRIEIRLGEALLARRRGDDAAALRLLGDARAQAERDLDPQHMLFEAIEMAAGGACPPHSSFPRRLAVLRVCRALEGHASSIATILP